LSQLALTGTLKDRGGAHEWSDKENCEPGGDENIIEDQRDGRSRLEANEAVVFFIQHSDSIEDHQHENDGVRCQEQDIGTIKLFGQSKKQDKNAMNIYIFC